MGKRFLDVHRTKDGTFYGPLKWNGQARSPGGGLLIFTCSLSDFFIEEADGFREEMWEVIRRTPQHTYQILTKRPERIEDHLPEICYRCGLQEYGHPDIDPTRVQAGLYESHDFHGWPWPNVWLGTSIEMEQYLPRMAILAKVPAMAHFLSVEPMLGPIDFQAYRHGIWFRCMDWVIVGGESNPGGRPRPTKPEWVRSVRDQCREEGIPFFFKQWGGISHCKCHKAWGCRVLDGRTHDELPVQTLPSREAHIPPLRG